MMLALSRSTPFSAPELATRVAVTLGALAIYRLGVALPLPGIDAEGLYATGVISIDRTSVFALGVVPMTNALLLVEIARLLSKRFNDWGAATPANARRINRWVLVGTLLMAAIQAYGIAVAFEGVPGVVADPGPEFRLAVVTTLVGGTVLLAWLAALISWHGVGSGFWILFLAPYLAGLPATILRYAEFERVGVLSQAGVVSILAYVLIAVASVSVLGLVLARRGMPLERTLIWPQVIGAVPVNFLLLFLGPTAPLYNAALAVVIIAVSLAQSRRAAVGLSATPAGQAVAVPVVLTALVLAAVAVVPHLLAAQLGVQMPVDGLPITAAVGITLGARSLLPGIEPDKETCQSAAPG